MLIELYNNTGIAVLAVAFVAEHAEKPIELSKLLLVAPIVAHKTLLDHLARANTKVSSIEGLVVKKTRCFSNFNARYYDNLTESINAIQYLIEVESGVLKDGKFVLQSAIDYKNTMGKRAKKIFKASPKIAQLLECEVANLYSTLRVQI